MSPWWTENWRTVAGITSGFLLFLVAQYIAYKRWKRKVLYYIIRSNNFFTGLETKVPDVEVKFSGYGSAINALTVTKIAFWNSGTETIRKGDVVKDDQVAIKAKNGSVLLSVLVRDAVNPLNKIECLLNRERTQATITFDYLERNEGAIIQLFHTGVGNEDITVTGTILGPTPIKRRPVHSGFVHKKNDNRNILIAGSILWLLWGIAAYVEWIVGWPVFWQTKAPVYSQGPSEPIDGTGPLIYAFIFLVLMTSLFLFLIYKHYTPKFLTKIHTD